MLINYNSVIIDYESRDSFYEIESVSIGNNILTITYFPSTLIRSQYFSNTQLRAFTYHNNYLGEPENVD